MVVPKGSTTKALMETDWGEEDTEELVWLERLVLAGACVNSAGAPERSLVPESTPEGAEG